MARSRASVCRVALASRGRRSRTRASRSASVRRLSLWSGGRSLALAHQGDALDYGAVGCPSMRDGAAVVERTSDWMGGTGRITTERSESPTAID
jgi:hypothetical protein